MWLGKRFSIALFQPSADYFGFGTDAGDTMEESRVIAKFFVGSLYPLRFWISLLSVVIKFILNVSNISI